MNIIRTVNMQSQRDGALFIVQEFFIASTGLCGLLACFLMDLLTGEIRAIKVSGHEIATRQSRNSARNGISTI